MTATSCCSPNRIAPNGTTPPSGRASCSCARRFGAGHPGASRSMAAIAAVHAEAPSWDATDWREIVGLYDLLVEMWPSPVVALNRAVAVGLAEGPAAGLAALDALATEPLLATYSYLASARADFLRRLDRTSEARVAYEEALLLSENVVERAFLVDRLAQMGS